MSKNPNQVIIELREKALSTEVKQWRRISAAIFFTILCVLAPTALLLLLPEIAQDKQALFQRFFGLSVFWLICELLIIWYIFKTKTLPIYVRECMHMVVAISNIWFVLFIVAAVK